MGGRLGFREVEWDLLEVGGKCELISHLGKAPEDGGLKGTERACSWRSLNVFLADVTVYLRLYVKFVILK